MVLEKQKYLLSSRPQLIDLNKNFKNFRLQFQVTAIDPTQEFQALVMNQEQLDTNTDLNAIEMKIAKGKIGGNIVADNDKYQNYFLILKKSPKDLETSTVEVELTKNIEEVPVNITKEDPPDGMRNEDNGNEMQQQRQREYYEGHENQQQQQENTVSSMKPFYRKTWFWILIAVVIVFALFYYYFYVYSAKSNHQQQQCLLPALEAGNDDISSSQEKMLPQNNNTVIMTEGGENTGKQEKLYKRLTEIQ